MTTPLGSSTAWSTEAFRSRRLDELEVIVEGATLLDALAVAIAVEDSLGVVLHDEDISAERLCDRQALRVTVERRLASDRRIGNP